MMRSVLAVAVGIALVPGLTGCGDSTPEDDKMTQRREPPAQKRAAPGAGLGLNAEEGDPDDTPAGGDD